jgi:hypothetical protein
MSTDLTPSRVEQQAPAGHAVLRVPWRAVLPLAVVLTLADLFWVGALRVAVGHISRNQSPFESWMRESLLSLPIFVLAALGALTLALHRFGPSPRGARQVLSTMGLLVGATTLAGTAVLAASTYYDYRLESDGERAMGAMRQSCTGSCAELAQEATVRLQLQALGWGTALILITNLVLVAWGVAALGGRLRIGTSRPEGFRVDARTVLVAGLVGSAAIHAAVVPEHLDEWAAAGSFFVILTAAELAVAGWLYFGARVPALLAAAAVSGGPLLVWLWSRSSGLPFGPEPGAPEPVGMADVAASLLEVLTLVLAVVLLRRVLHAGRSHGTRARTPAPNGARLALVAVVAVTALGMAGTPLSWFGVQVEGSSHASQDVESS